MRQDQTLSTLKAPREWEKKRGYGRFCGGSPKKKLSLTRMLVRHPGNQCAQPRDLQQEVKNLSQFLRPGHPWAGLDEREHESLPEDHLHTDTASNAELL